MPSKSISEVIQQLEHIVGQSETEGHALGIFAQLYLGVTRAVAEGIQNGRFEDGPRMEKLDVIFANRYLLAYQQFSEGETPTQSWQTAFEATNNRSLLTLQHLLMGMNAHINLDLGIAAAEAVGAGGLDDLKNDFLEINLLLAERVEDVQARLGSVSPLLFLLDIFGKKSDEHFTEFSLEKVRSHAWRVAERISALPPKEKAKSIGELDHYVAMLNQAISRPGRVFGWLVRFIKFFEVKDVRRLIGALGE